MEELNPKKPASPSEFYRMHRPEYFSDSMEIVEVELPKEVLSRELSLITTNLRTEEFETLCRKISEKLICPNLIPQVGPVGGGDGKTDFETYPVSNAISDRWFIPENGWDIDQKWAFAISAKETWKSKADSDIKKIVGTGRGFTRIYFITNQLPSSRERKEAEDDFKNLYKLDIVVLDGKWLLESIYENDLIELVVDVLNLSESFKKRTKQLGRNDTARLRELDELEKAIGSPNRYFEYDHQIVEDALQVAILSRMLERPRLELEGKFDRALRLCEKGGTAKQRLRIFYQRAWTMVNWYDDYAEFVHCYKTCKGLISSESSIQEVELLYNLINIFHGISASDACDLSTLGIDLAKEDESFEQLLSEIEADQTKPNAALTAKTQKCILRIFRSASKGANVDSHIKDLIICFESCSGLFEYPFEKYRDIIQVLGESFSNNQEFDKLFDCIANESEARSSQLAGGQTYMERGFQKLKAGINKDAIVYFGRAVRKLAKEESKNDIYFALRGLGQAYEAVGLLWASNSCYTAALEISLKSWFQGKINERSYNCAKELAENELLLGRFPAFLNWHELLEVLNHQLDIEKDQQIPFNHFRDACLAIRILNAAAKNDDVFRAIPDLLLEKNLGVSWLASQYRLGNIDLIRPELSKAGVNGDDQIQDFFERAATQPFRNQISHDLNFLSGDTVILSSTILGCAFQFRIERNRELVFATEMIIAFFEGFLATSFEGIFPHKEFIEFKVSTSHTGEFVEFDDAEPEGKLRLNLDEYGKARMVDSLILLVSKVLAKNFHIEQYEKRLKDLFENEEIMERLSIISEHPKFTHNVLGSEPKIFFNDWIKENHKVYEAKLDSAPIFSSTKGNDLQHKEQIPRHNDRLVQSVIDVELWNKAHWMAFGSYRPPGKPMAIILGYKDIEAGLKIFERWRNKYGERDTNEEIRISIIKGVSKKHPFWYRVHVTKKLDLDKTKSGTHILTISRFHELNAESPINLNGLLMDFNKHRDFLLVPAEVDPVTQQMRRPFFEKGILKRELIVKEAWEISLDDQDATAIRSSDEPVVPQGVSTSIFEVIEWKKKIEMGRM